MNVKPKFVYYDIRRKQSVCLVMYTHENDVDTQVLEVSMLDNGEPIELDTDYTYLAAIVNRDTKALINDSISCELNDSGNVLIPIDNFHTLGAQDLLIELTITDSAGNQVLVTPFPLWIHVNASILDDAQVTPESEGTVPELLVEAKEALEDAQQAIEDAGDYNNLDNKPSINGHELVGNKSSDDLGLQGKLTAGENVTINANGEISASGGVTSYNDLTDKPTIDGYTIGNLQVSFRGLDYRQSNGDEFLGVDKERVLNRLSSLSDNIYNGPSLFGFQNQGLKPIQLPNDATGVIFQFRNDRIFYDEYDQLKTQILQHKIFFSTETGEMFLKLDSKINGEETNIGQWRRVGGSQIVSGVVNQNGTITFTMSDGSTVTTTGESVIGPQGDDYVLTPQDKTDIANIVLSKLPTTQGVQYGNTSN